jgi:hypothetical protein
MIIQYHYDAYQIRESIKNSIKFIETDNYNSNY